MIVKPLASTRPLSALGVGPPAFVSELMSMSSSATDFAGLSMLVSTIAKPVIEATPTSISEVQTMGEIAFSAAFAIAACQAAVAVLQYHNNPSGQLVVPPGPTQGTEIPGCPLFLTTEDNNPVEDCKREKNSWFRGLKEIETEFSVEENHEDQATVRSVNRSLAFLLPWAANVLGSLLDHNCHIFHLLFAFGLAQLFDFPKRLFPLPTNEDRKNNDISPSAATATAATTAATNDNFFSKTVTGASSSIEKMHKRILVIGDSLVAGVGAVNLFEADGKELREGQPQSLPGEVNGPGPVFPRVLAQTLSQETGNTVSWRSEGVVGGDTGDIEEQCLYALREEVDKGQAPDLVVVISGMNDLKHFASNPVQYPGPQAFRSRIVSVIDKIQEISPSSKIVLPSLPTQIFERDSPLNIFPLVGFVSAVVGIWDAQKKYISDRYPDSNVEYIDLPRNEIHKWYETDSTSEFGLEEQDPGKIGLMSADGIHPNALCYVHWAASLAKKLAATTDETKNIHERPSANTVPFLVPTKVKSPSFVHA